MVDWINCEVKLGFNNTTADGKYILLFDCDIRKHLSDMLLLNLYRLADKYSLSDFYVIETVNGFHAICLDKFSSIQQVYTIYKQLRYADKKHLAIGLKRKKYTLAVDENKRKFAVIRTGNRYMERSNAHRILLNKIYGFNIKRDLYFDSYKELEIEVFVKWSGESI